MFSYYVSLFVSRAGHSECGEVTFRDVSVQHRGAETTHLEPIYARGDPLLPAQGTHNHQFLLVLTLFLLVFDAEENNTEPGYNPCIS